MARETQTHTIGDVEYKITQLGAKQGRKVLAHVLRVVGAVADAKDPVASLSRALSDDEVDFLCDTFAKTTRFSEDGGEKEFELAVKFDDHFVGKYDAMLEWLWTCLTVNFSSFLGGLGRIQAAVAATLEATSPKKIAAGSSDSSMPATEA